MPNLAATAVAYPIFQPGASTAIRAIDRALTHRAPLSDPVADWGARTLRAMLVAFAHRAHGDPAACLGQLEEIKALLPEGAAVLGIPREDYELALALMQPAEVRAIAEPLSSN